MAVYLVFVARARIKPPTQVFSIFAPRLTQRQCFARSRFGPVRRFGMERCRHNATACARLIRGGSTCHYGLSPTNIIDASAIKSAQIYPRRTGRFRCTERMGGSNFLTQWFQLRSSIPDFNKKRQAKDNLSVRERNGIVGTQFFAQHTNLQI